MARAFVSGLNQSLTQATGIVTAYPFTFACWVDPGTLTGSPVFIGIGSATTGSSAACIYMNATPAFTILTQDHAAGSDTASSSVTPVVQTWYHVCGVFASATSKTIYVNGGNSAVSTTNRVLTAGDMNATAIAAGYFGGTPTNFYNGGLAFPAIWNVALTATEVAALGAWAHPLLVHPSAIVSCLDLSAGSSPETDLVSASTWTVNGASTVSANPPIYM